MKHFFFILTLALAAFNSHAQSPCDTLTFYGVEEDFTVYASNNVISITVIGNWEGESVLLAEANENVVGVYNTNPTNFLPYESLTICTSTMNTSCCDTYVWIGPTMYDGEWVILESEMNCEFLDIMVTSSSETTINMTSNTESCMDPALGPFTYLWSGYTSSGDFIVMSSLEDLNTYLADEIYLSDSVVICFEVTGENEDVCQVCDTLFYNGPINEWISINDPDPAVDLDCELIEIEIATQSDYYIEMTSNALEVDGVFIYTWATNGSYGNSITLDQNMFYDTIVSCITIIDEYDENCEVCETLVLTNNGWVVSSDNQADPNESLYEICDSLIVFSTFSSENSVTLSTNIDSSFSDLEIGFNWESWGDYLNVEMVEGQDAFFDIPNNMESFYFLLQVVISNNLVDNSEVLCVYPFLIEWDSQNNNWQANSLTLEQMPLATSIGSYANQGTKKLVKIVDVLGRENQGDKNMVLFYMYDDGTIEKKFILE